MKIPVRTTLLSVAGIAALGYGSIVAMLLWLQGRLIYPLERIRDIPPHPDADRLSPAVVRTRDGLEIGIRYKPPATPDAATIVLFHGNGEDLSQRVHIAHALVEVGYGVVLAEYRGYGGNPGKPHEAGLYADGRAALEFAYRQTSRVVLHGYSLGSGVAVQMATEYPVEALLLEAPFTCMADVARTRFPYVPVRWMLRDRYDNLAKIGAVRAPVLIYGGLADQLIPPRQFAALHAAVPGLRRLVLIDDADHVDVWTKGGAGHVLSFLRALPAGTRRASPDTRMR
ncbi:alpha/beta hydrolase [Trinickia sp. EG282A]|uniref:alpha/beta hydrolase n=1 Tax=Trinickia sp. EG282A TaxID=3237013 RepID=UPI0034D35DFC